MAVKVQRAVFLAAGKGSRLAPVTDTLPKPLVEVKGRRIIDSLLDAVIAAGIREIYLVLGYRKEAFSVLLEKYPGLRFIENPDFEEANNISSVAYAGNLLSNAYVIESDLWLRNPALIASYQEESNYLSIPVEETDDWCFFLNGEGYIRRIAVGGKNCEQMVGISYWSEEDGLRLARRAEELYRRTEKRQLYWDQVALEEFLPEFRVRTRHCRREDVTEIDTLEELQAIDPSYNEVT